MSYSIEWTPQAIRSAKTIHIDILFRFDQKLLAITKKENPCEGLKKIHTKKGMVLYSLRDGDHRMLLTIENDILYIFVVGIGLRKTIYRKFQS